MTLVMNLMTEPGETDGYTAADHVRGLLAHVPHGAALADLAHSRRAGAGLHGPAALSA